MIENLNAYVQVKTIMAKKPYVEFTLEFLKPDCTLKCKFDGDTMASEWVTKWGYGLSDEFLATCLEIIDKYIETITNEH